MNKILKTLLIAMSFVCVIAYGGFNLNTKTSKAFAYDQQSDCFCVYDAEDEEKLVFMKGESVSVDDQYISADNKLYIVESVDEETRTGKARYKENVKMPVYKINKNNIQGKYTLKIGKIY